MAYFIKSRDIIKNTDFKTKVFIPSGVLIVQFYGQIFVNLTYLTNSKKLKRSF